MQKRFTLKLLPVRRVRASISTGKRRKENAVLDVSNVQIRPASSSNHREEFAGANVFLLRINADIPGDTFSFFSYSHMFIK